MRPPFSGFNKMAIQAVAIVLGLGHQNNWGHSEVYQMSCRIRFDEMIVHIYPVYAETNTKWIGLSK